MTSYILTNQKVPLKEKTKEWHKNHIKEFVAIAVKRTETERKRQQLKCLKYYLCIIDKEKESANRPITNPYGLSLGLEWISYPLIESKLEQMIGEFITRGIKKKTYVLNKAAQTKKLNELYDMISEEILREVNKEVAPALGFEPQTEQPTKELPKDVEEWFEKSYKTVSEEVSDTILNQVLVSKKQIDKVKDLFLDFLLYDECIGFVEEKDGQPSIRKCNIFETELDYNPDEEIQNDPQYIIFNKFLGYNQIMNSYDLTDEEEKQLQSYMTIKRDTSTDFLDGGDGYDSGSNYGDWIQGEREMLRIRSVEMYWISQVKIRVKVSLNKKTGKEIYKSVPEDYKARSTDNIKSIWAEQKRKCVMIGPDLVLDYGVDNERFSRIDDPRKDSLPIVAVRRNGHMNVNELRSAATKLVQLQDFASECLFELRLAMRRSNGRVLVYDAAQVPKQFLKTGGYQNAINRVMHHAKKDQFLIINSSDKQGRYAFNQFTSLDLSTKGLMQDLFNTLALVEDLASKFLGISPQQSGQVSQYESATGTERAVAQTTVRQEVYVKPFESFLKYLFDKILIKGKYCYEENEVSQYIFGDSKTKFFKVYPDYHQEDVGVYIGDSYNDQKKKAVIDRGAEQAMASAQTHEVILNMIETLNAETAGESEAILKRGLNALNALKEQTAKAEAENTEKQAEATRYAADKASEDKDKQLQNNIDVANIYADNKGVTETMKNETQRTMKLADIEKELLLSQEKNNNNSK